MSLWGTTSPSGSAGLLFKTAAVRKRLPISSSLFFVVRLKVVFTAFLLSCLWWASPRSVVKSLLCHGHGHRHCLSSLPQVDRRTTASRARCPGSCSSGGGGSSDSVSSRARAVLAWPAGTPLRDGLPDRRPDLRGRVASEPGDFLLGAPPIKVEGADTEALVRGEVQSAIAACFGYLRRIRTIVVLVLVCGVT